MTDLKSQVATITGASSGVGLNASLVLVARAWYPLVAAAFARALFTKITDLARSSKLWTLTEQLVGLS
jgi:NAD(P)-dependent dehydrogenase (short-subunit alcohol dehydrogenase family)